MGALIGIVIIGYYYGWAPAIAAFLIIGEIITRCERAEYR